MDVFTGGVTCPAGFWAAAGRAGIKKDGDDLAVIWSEAPAEAAAVFTTNVIKAAPVVWSQRIAAKGRPVRAVVVNSGNANACTGETGLAHAIQMGEAVASALGVAADEVLVASTGVIGVLLPIDRVCAGIAATCAGLARGEAADLAAAHAIMTTDTVPKRAAAQVKLSDGTVVTVAGMAKGSGMIHPNMATMLAFLTTDARVDHNVLQTMLQESVADSYNMVSVDGDTSTNDCVFVLANGRAGGPEIRPGTKDAAAFFAALHAVNQSLAQQIARDGEGATKFLTVTVQGARTRAEARQLARAVVRSNLVKAAFFGEDANWGRIVAALGYAGVAFEPRHLGIAVASAGGRLVMMEHGEPVWFDEEAARQVLAARDIAILVTLGDGDASATAWGCDLSYEYVRINGQYRT
ncbi:arginine biosynthesis bifunctional protein ArgJ [Alicyclobacillus cellulosilyticus]|uniref:Arginine biosynthesis bifunctional protein ArgJ n=1 Tax=Alicyclobacillus cellulosilyticus TaxID=1003997 RepID=A0A917KFI0_9BACL|nr:bifunctional glutamate N-acetyltransferase/amino-acid acetyltransferase ArgJ [Alicyclobacillus cellulosilyticus]GGJ10027.1 arginine biosynthesis bifunctional protein ArgJ [Alicyclobacillus cellulosilyticus]